MKPLDQTERLQIFAAEAFFLHQRAGTRQTCSMTAADSAGGAAAPQESAARSEAFPIASGTLRADAARLVTVDRATLADLSAQAARGGYAGAREPLGEGKAADPPVAVTRAEAGADKELLRDGATCLDPLVPGRLTRLAVTYDGVAATAVLRPVRPAADGVGRVRVEVWDCATPQRLAAVVVRR